MLRLYHSVVGLSTLTEEAPRGRRGLMDILVQTLNILMGVLFCLIFLGFILIVAAVWFGRDREGEER